MSSRIEDRTEDFKDAVTTFIKACKEQIDLLKNSTTNEEVNTKGWHGIKGSDASNADAVAHKHGVVPPPPPSPPRLCSQTEDQPVSDSWDSEIVACSSGWNTAPVPRNRVIQCKARDGDEDPEWLRCEVERMEIKFVRVGSALERQGKEIKQKLAIHELLLLKSENDVVSLMVGFPAVDLESSLFGCFNSEVKNHLCKIEEFQFKVNPFISDKLLCIAYFVSLQMRLRIRPRFKGCGRDLEGWE
ncbi:hypothetical protein Tsubulata_037066 [Turnera subulata]|uniref:Uncharacterized protein n=1 Tax=Turnera subulata TaxID=218843 RepID=A0A9Q0GCQ7_9ROSI|nr:hypothetical protein Tsubulata_037066 [Turnera subulata]